MEDVPLLVQHFIRKHGPKRKDILIRIFRTMPEHADEYQYPAMSGARKHYRTGGLLFLRAEILPSSLPPVSSADRSPQAGSNPQDARGGRFIRAGVIWSALQEARGNISRAAQILASTVSSFQRKIKQLKIAT